MALLFGAQLKIQHLSLSRAIYCLLGCGLKVILEQLNGPNADIGKLINSTVAIDAHLIGAIRGTLLAAPLLVNYIKNKN